MQIDDNEKIHDENNHNAHHKDNWNAHRNDQPQKLWSLCFENL